MAVANIENLIDEAHAESTSEINRRTFMISLSAAMLLLASGQEYDEANYNNKAIVGAFSPHPYETNQPEHIYESKSKIVIGLIEPYIDPYTSNLRWGQPEVLESKPFKDIMSALMDRVESNILALPGYVYGSAEVYDIEMTQLAQFSNRM